MTEIPLADRIEAWRHTAECSPSPAQRAQARDELIAVGEDVSDLRDDLSPDEMVAGNIGRRIRDLRVAAGMSQDELAATINQTAQEWLREHNVQCVRPDCAEPATVPMTIDGCFDPTICPAYCDEHAREMAAKQ